MSALRSHVMAFAPEEDPDSPIAISAVTGARASALLQSPAHPSRRGSTGSPASSAPLRSARTHVSPNGRAQRSALPGLDAPAGSPLSPIDLLHRVDHHFALGEHALQLGVLGFERAQPIDVGGLELDQSVCGTRTAFGRSPCISWTLPRSRYDSLREAWQPFCSSVNRLFFIGSLGESRSHSFKLRLARKTLAGQRLLNG